MMKVVKDVSSKGTKVEVVTVGRNEGGGGGGDGGGGGGGGDGGE